MPHRRHRPSVHCDHTDPQERPIPERGLPGFATQKQTPARHPARRQGILEALDRIPCPQPPPGGNARPQGIRRPHRRKSPRSPHRRNPDRHRVDEPLRRPRHRRDRSRRRKSMGKGEATPHSGVAQQRPSDQPIPNGPSGTLLHPWREAAIWHTCTATQSFASSRHSSRTPGAEAGQPYLPDPASSPEIR